MKKFFLLTKFLLAGATVTLAQSVGINNTGAQAHASAILDVSSNSKGLLIPRMTTAQRTAIATPAIGLQVYQTDGTTGFYYFDGAAWKQMGADGANPMGWLLTGNAGNDPATNFIGTSDAQPFIGKVNGQQVFHFSSKVNNTVLGYQASHLNSNGGNSNHLIGFQAGYNNIGNFNHFDGLQAGYSNSADYNQFTGYNAGFHNTTGNYNFFHGFAAGTSNTTGSENQFIGYQSGYNTTTGIQNYFNGISSGYSNVTGKYNHFSGFHAGYFNNADNNHFEGFSAGYNNTSGTENTFIGLYSGINSTSGSRNIFIGEYAGSSSISANENMAIGYEAGIFNTADYNHFIGYRSGYTNTSGTNNHFDGYKAGALNTTGSYNNFIGNQAGYANTTGSSNVFMGYKSGFTNATGTNNIFIGLGSGFTNYNGNNNTFIGQSAGHENVYGDGNVALGNFAGYNETGNNKLYIANSATTTPLIYGEFDNQLLGINGIEQIIKYTAGNQPILSLKATTPDYVRIAFTNATNSQWIAAGRPDGNVDNAYFDFDHNGLFILELQGTGDAFLNGNLFQASDRKLKENINPLKGALQSLLKLNGYTYNWINKSKSSAQQIGLIAQEVEEQFPQLVHTDTAGNKSVAYGNMVPVLVESIKEQQTMIEELKAATEASKKDTSALKVENEQLKKDIQAIKAKLGL